MDEKYSNIMNRDTLPEEIVSKLSGYSWIKLGSLSDNKQIRMLITIQENSENYEHQIEATGFKILTRFKKKFSIIGYVRDIPKLASLNFIEYLELSNSIALERL